MFVQDWKLNRDGVLAFSEKGKSAEENPKHQKSFKLTP
jgi:hypothetical protein